MRLRGLSIALAALVLSGCAGVARVPIAPEVLSPDRAATDAVAITQHDFHFDVGRASARSGSIDFDITNEGTVHHELVVVRYNAGRFSEPVAEHEALDPHEHGLLRVTLTPGHYRLVCLLVTVKPEGPVSNIDLGMNADFEVTP